MLINDRLDIALAVNASGVHVGQDDMPLTLARKLLPKGSIIGVSCNTVRDVQQAVLDGADYVGIGPVWPTPTKTDTEPAIGVRGLGVLLAALEGSSVGSVAIGMQYPVLHTCVSHFTAVRRNKTFQSRQSSACLPIPQW